MSLNQQPQPSHEAIASRAFQLWMQEGQPQGDGERHWLQAEAELKNGSNAKQATPVNRRAKRAVASA
jgi:hypothetical protein